MPEQPKVLKDRQNESPNATPTLSPSSTATEWSGGISWAIGICSLFQIGCFFLPWIRILSVGASGFQLQRLPGNEMKLLWFIPIAGLISLLSAITQTHVKHITQFAGIIPFLALTYFGVKIGKDLFQALEVGAWLTLLFGAALFALARCLKKP